jgi:predicted membrane protein
MRDNWQRHHERRLRRRGGDKTVFGLIIILLGAVFLLHRLDIVPFFYIRSLWPLILIAIGVMIGIRNRFSNPGSWVLIFIGTVNFIPRMEIVNGHYTNELIFPLALIMLGAFILVRSRKKKYFMERMNMNTITNADNVLNIDVTFGGRKEIITSKDFKGGSISATFAGAEVNLMQADSLTQPITLDIRVAFGGVELLVPSHWEIQNEIAPAFGSVEDHRVMRTANAGEEKKVLVLKGSCSFGSVEIKSY